MAMLEQVRAQQGVFGDGVGDEKEQENAAENKTEKEGSDSSDEEEDEEPDDQIAHEWLEIARVLYQKRNGKENKLKEASCLGLLADLKSENGQLEEARDDYNSALKIYQEHLEQNDRKIATVLYQLGSVELFLQMPKEAKESFESS